MTDNIKTHISDTENEVGQKRIYCLRPNEQFVSREQTETKHLI